MRAYALNDGTVGVPEQRSILEGVSRLAVVDWTRLATIIDIVDAYKVEIALFCLCPESGNGVLS